MLLAKDGRAGEAETKLEARVSVVRAEYFVFVLS
jgi:hypothetical protein